MVSVMVPYIPSTSFHLLLIVSSPNNNNNNVILEHVIKWNLRSKAASLLGENYSGKCHNHMIRPEL